MTFFENAKMASKVTMKHRIEVVFLMALICANVSAFVPNFFISRTTVIKSTDISVMSSSPTTLFSSDATASGTQVKSRSNVARSKEKNQVVQVGSRRSNGAKKKKPKTTSKKNTKETNEFQWLNWVYNQWESTQPGDLSDEVLKQMVPAISGWARRKTLYSAERAEELLERIVDENLAGNPLAELTVNLFNAAMNAYAKVGNPDKVQKVLRRMDGLSTEHDHLAHLKPDNFSMSILATAWAKSRSPDASAKAEAILNYMEIQKMTPNVITYNAVLHALALGNQIDKAVRAEDVVMRMKTRHAEGEDCKPDIYSYQSLIQAWSGTSLPGSPQRAETILRFLDQEFEKGDTSLSPNAYCFTTTIHAWARSGERHRARSAYQILNHMTKRYLENDSAIMKPNVRTLTAVLNACARPADEYERDDAFDIAELVMAELSLGTYDKPNFLSFAAFLSVCCSTVAPGEGRDVIVRRTFEQCIDAGQVAQIVLTKLRIAATPELYEELVGKYTKHDGSMKIPSRWTAYIKGERSHSEEVTTATRSRIPRDSKLRLDAVQRFGGRSGFYSRKVPIRPESEGITWSKRSLGEEL